MKKIDPKKLLPPSKGSSIQKKLDSSVLVPIEKIKLSYKKITIPKKEEGVDETSKENVTDNLNDLKDTISKLFNLVKDNFKFIKKKSNDERNEKEKEQKQKKEEDLEKKKTKQEKFPNIKTPSIPGVGIIDYIKNFLKWVIIGRAVTLFAKHLPKLIEFAKKLAPVYEFFKTLSGTVFNALVSFIDWGYKAQETLKNTLSSLGGEPFNKAFNDFNGALNTFMNLALIAGMSTMGGLDPKSSTDVDIDAPGRTPRRTPRRTPKITGDSESSSRRLRNPLRRRPRITGSGNTSIRPKPRITGSPQNLKKLSGSVGAKLAPKTILRHTRPLLKRLPFIGALIDFGLSVALGEPLGRAAFKAIGAGLLGTIGTGFGGPLGAILGGMAGDWAGGKLYDILFTGKKSTGPNAVQRKNKGGVVKPKTGKVISSRKQTVGKPYVKKPIKIPSRKSQPGKDVGGERAIKKLYPDTDPKSITKEEWINATDAKGDRFAGTYRDYIEYVRSNVGKKPNPYKALTETAKTLKQIPLIGSVMGGAVDVALGESLDAKKLLSQFSSGISYIVDTIASQKISTSIAGLANDVRGFAEGGTISSSGVNNSYSSITTGEVIEKILGPNIEQRINDAVNNVQKEIQKKGSKKPEDGDDKGGMLDGDIDAQLGSDIKVTSESPDFWLLVTAALFENGNPKDGYQGAADVAQAIYNRVALPGWPKSIRKVILSPNQFQPVRQYGGTREWENIKTKDDAIKFAKKYKGYTGNIVERIAATLLNSEKQQKAREFVGPRDSFRSVSYEDANDHLAEDTEARRYGHVFGFEPRGRNIESFRKGKLKPSEVNRKVVTGDVQDLGVDFSQDPGKFRQITGDSGKSQGNVPLSVQYSPFTSNKGRPRISSGKGIREGREHKGLDIEADEGTPMYSYIPGTVVFSGSAGAYGYRLEIKDSKGNIHSFSHLQSNPGFKRGQKIQQGQFIGRVGSTGRSTGPHLHWEIQNSSGDYQDPVVWTKQNPLPKPKSKLQLAQDAISKMKLGDAPYEVPGVGKVVIKKNEYGTIVKEYYDTNGNIIDSGDFFERVKGNAPKPNPKPKQSSINKNVIDASKLTNAEIINTISSLKPGQVLNFTGVGSIQKGSDFFGRPVTKYYNPSGKTITEKEFRDAFKKSSLLNTIRSNARGLVGGGNLIDNSYKKLNNTSGLNNYASYEEENYIVFIQPIHYIQEEPQTYINSGSSRSSSVILSGSGSHNLFR